LEELAGRIEALKLPKEDFLIDVDGTLGLYGAKKVEVVGFLAVRDHERPVPDLIYNPAHHFWFHGFKFINVKNSMKFLKNRNNKEDAKILKLMRKFAEPASARFSYGEWKRKEKQRLKRVLLKIGLYKI